MIFDVQRETPFDLKFRLFGTFVRVHPFFWLVSVLMGSDLLKSDNGIALLLVWVLCIFFSILMHEFGHIWMGRIYGGNGYIVLQGLCGLAIDAGRGSNRWQRIAISLAGPGIQLVFIALLMTVLALIGPAGVTERALQILSRSEVGDFVLRFRVSLAVLCEQPGLPRLAREALHFLVWINLWWALINLLPVWPLDGGQISRELFLWRSSSHGVRNSLALSMATALIVAANGLSAALGGPRIPILPAGDGRFVAILFGIFALENFIQLQMENARLRGGWRDRDDERMPWERDPDEWKRQ